MVDYGFATDVLERVRPLSPANLLLELHALPEAVVGQVSQHIGVRIEDYASPDAARGLRDLITEATTVFLEILESGRSEVGPLPPKVARVVRDAGFAEGEAGRDRSTLSHAYDAATHILRGIVDGAAKRWHLGADLVERAHLLTPPYVRHLQIEGLRGYDDFCATLSGPDAARVRLGQILTEREHPSDRIVTRLARVAHWQVPHAVTGIELHRVGERECEALPTLVAEVFGAEALLAGTWARPLVLVPGEADAELAVERLGADAWASIGLPSRWPRVVESLASAALIAQGFPSGPDEGAVLRACDHAADLIPADSVAQDQMVHRWLAPLESGTAGARLRRAETLHAMLSVSDRAADVGKELCLPASTARDRINGVRELFGDQLSDGTARSNMLLTLHLILPRWRAEAGAAKRRKAAKKSFSAAEDEK